MGCSFLVADMQPGERAMPWKDLSAMKQREEFVLLARVSGSNLSELCRRFGISRTKGLKWKKRYAAEGSCGLKDRSRRPHSSPSKSSDRIEAEVLRIRQKSNNSWGGRKIARVLRNEGWVAVPAASTITEILRRHGKLEEHRAEHRGPFCRFERAGPNELWQMDFKGHFATLNGRCHPLTVLDDHSRYSLGIEACANEQEATVVGRLTAIFRCYGLPLQMLMDNGPPWGTGSSGFGFTALEIWLMRHGIAVLHGRPYHPQTQGKDERFHRSLNTEVIRAGNWLDLEACQNAFDDWRPIYNHERPHEALDLDTPASRYRVSPLVFCEQLPAIDYPSADFVRKVDAYGFFSFHNRPWRLGKAFRTQPIGLIAGEQDGVFDVYFCRQLLGVIDFRRDFASACGFVDIARARGDTSPDAHNSTGSSPKSERF
jgi:transposase InsO family protein